MRKSRRDDMKSPNPMVMSSLQDFGNDCQQSMGFRPWLVHTAVSRLVAYTQYYKTQYRRKFNLTGQNSSPSQAKGRPSRAREGDFAPLRGRGLCLKKGKKVQERCLFAALPLRYTWRSARPYRFVAPFLTLLFTSPVPGDQPWTSRCANLPTSC